MTLEEQIIWADNLQTEFYNLHKQFGMFPLYDGHYEELADNMEYVIESLWELQGLHK